MLGTYLGLTVVSLDDGRLTPDVGWRYPPHPVLNEQYRIPQVETDITTCALTDGVWDVGKYSDWSESR